MANRCGICESPMREEVGKALNAGRSEREVSAEFGFTKASVHRHKAHIRDILLQAAPNLDEIGVLEAEARKLLESRVEKIRLDAIARLQSLRNDRLRIQSEQQGSSALTSDPAFQHLASVLVTCLCDTCKGVVDDKLSELLGTPIPKPTGGGDTRSD